MGALPTRKISKRRAGFRKQHQKIKLPQLMTCPQCRNPKETHRVCPTCGTYNGRQVIQPRQRTNAPS
ncbi:MAG TPA: 50S ribosomal protein L32 [Dehalococcoidia bacterium]|nr:50S ribosomal protein L32 [Dehalococcoidia bacterium]